MANFEIIQKVTGASYYYRLVRLLDGYIWNNVLGVWAATVAWADSMITVTESNASGDYPLVIPTTMNGSGDANLTVYTLVAGNKTDAIAYEQQVRIGGIFGF